MKTRGVRTGSNAPPTLPSVLYILRGGVIDVLIFEKNRNDAERKPRIRFFGRFHAVKPNHAFYFGVDNRQLGGGSQPVIVMGAQLPAIPPKSIYKYCNELRDVCGTYVIRRRPAESSGNPISC